MKLVTRYIDIWGFYEIKNGQEYRLFRNINKDPFTWKKYNQSLVLNNQNMWELQIPFDDVSLVGTENSIDAMEEILNSL